MRLSIITINRNNAEGLQKTIESVISQTFTDFEYIVIDGASIDGSLDVIKEYTDHITYWISEPDTGIYNAMNKGIKIAKGEYLQFLNSGDWLADKNVVADFIISKQTADIISGDIIIFNEKDYIYRETVDNQSLDYDFFYHWNLPHQATFIKRVLFFTYGLYNESLLIVSDWEFFLKVLILHNCSYSHLKRTISYFELNGISSNPTWEKILREERQGVLSKFLPRVYVSYDKIYDENLNLNSTRKEYLEYLNLKNGKFSFIIHTILKIKRALKMLKNVLL